MSLQIDQDYEYVGNDTWKWWVWIAGVGDELDRVEEVEYHLHPTFTRPVRRVRDRDTQFRLDSQGWGVFQLTARLKLSDGSTEQLSHMLHLAYPPDSEEALVAKEAVSRGLELPRPSVFLAAGTADEVTASELRASLSEKGVDVWSEEALRSSAPWEVELERAIEGSDAVIVLVSEVPSKWVEREVGVAQQHETRIIPVMLSEKAQLPSGLEAQAAIKLSGSEDLAEATSSILRAIEI